MDAIKEEKLKEKEAADYICRNVLNQYSLTTITGVTKVADLEKYNEAKRLEKCLNRDANSESLQNSLVRKRDNLVNKIHQNAQSRLTNPSSKMLKFDLDTLINNPSRLNKAMNA